MMKRTAILVAAIALGGSAIVLARHYQRPDPPTESPPPGMTLGSDSVTLTNDAPMWNVLKIAPAGAAGPHWTDPIPAKIMFDEAKTSRIGSPLAGRVTEVNVERGQSVKKGAVLFSVASPNLAELHADLDKAKLEAQTAKVNRDRVKALVDAGSVPAKELVSADAELAEANLAVQLAEQKLASLKVNAGGGTSFSVTSPRDGVVVEKSITVGQNADPTTGNLIAIADLSEVWVIADVFETDAGSLTAGAKSKVTLGGTTEIDGTIDQISQVVDPDRHTVPVRVRLANADGNLRPNSYATIRFYDSNPAKVSLPASAVLSDGATSYVYVVSANHTLKRRTIVVGATNGDQVRVLSGLEPGESVVVQGAILLDNQIQLEDG
jgi:cobalt-zinc-cadmium efflux system membrane fusion protein